jgi:predicted nucleic acid binding AN1-type Zn finger protein
MRCDLCNKKLRGADLALPPCKSCGHAFCLTHYGLEGHDCEGGVVTDKKKEPVVAVGYARKIEKI